jgi:hypothetical protein
VLALGVEETPEDESSLEPELELDESSPDASDDVAPES